MLHTVSKPARTVLHIASGIALRIVCGVASSWALLAAPAIAQTQERLPLWEVGAFATGVAQQAYPGASQRIDRALVLPFVIYRGKFLRSEDGTVGLRAIKTDTLEVDVGFGGSFGSNSNDIEARRGMPNLGTLVEFGPRVKWKLGKTPDNGRLRTDVALRGVFDLTDSFKDKIEGKIAIYRRHRRWVLHAHNFLVAAICCTIAAANNFQFVRSVKISFDYIAKCCSINHAGHFDS